jgi:hypothetical protein
LFLERADLTPINNIRAAGVPVIVIMVSGRPLYIESQLPDWDAFIAAWLPGTEGQGVADVLFGDVISTGTLSHSWPRDNGVPVNIGDPDYDPLFPYGYSIYTDNPYGYFEQLFPDAVITDGIAETWMGFMFLEDFPMVYHYGTGWIYLPPYPVGGGVYAYDMSENVWMYWLESGAGLWVYAWDDAPGWRYLGS